MKLHVFLYTFQPLQEQSCEHEVQIEAAKSVLHARQKDGPDIVISVVNCMDKAGEKDEPVIVIFVFNCPDEARQNV